MNANVYVLYNIQKLCSTSGGRGFGRVSGAFLELGALLSNEERLGEGERDGERGRARGGERRRCRGGDLCESC